MTKSEWYAKLENWAFDDPRLNRMPLMFLEPLAELLANDQAVEHTLAVDGATPEGFCECGISIESHTGVYCSFRPATKA